MHDRTASCVGNAAWITVPASVALLTVVTVGVALDLPGQSSPVMAAAAAALLVAATGIAWILVSRPGVDAQALAAVSIVGLAGAVLSGVLPSAPSFVEHGLAAA